MFELQARNKGLEFNYEYLSFLPSVVKADQKRLTQILINLLGNAVKFTEKGRIDFRIQYAREIAIIEVADTGPGINESEREKIFEAFARGSAANQINVGGTGLGLTISKLLTELMGGELSFTSVLGRGTSFQIKLFLPQIHHASEVEPTAFVSRIAYQGQRRKVLVVDNEEVDRELIMNILVPLGFEVAEAATGQECLTQFKAFKPDVILMDLAMPVMDGWEAAYQIRKIHQSDVPIAIVSANAFDKNLENAAKIPTEDFIVKPVNVQDLLDWLGKSLNIQWINEPDKTLGLIEHAEPVNIDSIVLLPPEDVLAMLLKHISNGYIKGIQSQLNAIELLDESYLPFTKRMRQYANNFEIDAMKRLIEILQK